MHVSNRCVLPSNCASERSAELVDASPMYSPDTVAVVDMGRQTFYSCPLRAMKISPRTISRR